MIWSNKIRVLPNFCVYNNSDSYKGFKVIDAHYIFYLYAEYVVNHYKCFSTDWLVGSNDFLKASEVTSDLKYFTADNLYFNKVPFTLANVQEVTRINTVISFIASKRLSNIELRNLTFT